MARKGKLRNKRPKVFGTKEWVTGALKRKFAPAPEGSDEQITTMADYLNYRKLHGILWPRKPALGKVIWIDPPDMRPVETPPDPQP